MNNELKSPMRHAADDNGALISIFKFVDSSARGACDGLSARGEKKRVVVVGRITPSRFSTMGFSRVPRKRNLRMYPFSLSLERHRRRTGYAWTAVYPVLNALSTAPMSRSFHQSIRRVLIQFGTSESLNETATSEVRSFMKVSTI